MNKSLQPVAVSMPNLTVATFIVDRKAAATAAGSYRHRHSGQELMPLMLDSVRRHHPDARFTILTTEETALPDLAYPFEVFARPTGDGPLLYARMAHYIAFLEQADPDRTYLFMETDMLMTGPLELPVTEDWDAAIAYKATGMWINSGVFLVRPGRKDAALAFLRRAYAIYGERYVGHKPWGSDQAAFRDALRMTKPLDRVTLVEVDGARILVVPRHKYAPFSKWYTWVMPPRTWILHFSARRKRAMPFFHWLHFGEGAGAGRILRRLSGTRV